MKRSLLIFLGLLCFCGAALAQKNIAGRVTSASGAGLAGVTVRETGKGGQAATNSQGNYKITVSEGASLVFRYVGYQSQEVAVNGRSVINVVLQENNASLDEVVVTAMGIERSKKSLGYSTPKVSGEDVSDTQREGFFQGLQGRVPGLSINSTSGMPGASAQIVLRGFASISGDNNALIVVDGVPINNSTVNENDLAMNGANRDLDYSNRALDINPSDIETYVVMKGPEATALYGSSGAGGAIIITTKKAKSGRFGVDYSYSGRMEFVNKFPERQYTYMQGLNGNYDGTSSYALGPKYKEDMQLNKDNVKNFFRNGYNQKHNLTFNGGNENLSYRWSNEYNDNTGIVPNTRYTRFSSRLNSTAKFSNKFELNTSFNFIFSDNDKARKGTTGYLMTLMRFNPLYDVRNWIDEKGNRVLNTKDIYNELDNPFWDVYRNIANDKTNRTLASSNFTYKPLSWLRFEGVVGIDYSNTKGESVYHPQSYSGSGSSTSPTGGKYSTYQNNTRILYGNARFSVNKTFGDYSISAFLGGEIRDQSSITDSQYGTNFFDPNFYSINNTYASTRLAKNIINNYRSIGFFGQAVLGYKTLLYLTLSGRLDGTSRLMPNDPYFSYPSGSLAFNFTDLNPIEAVSDVISDGKIRFSAGKTGKGPLRSYFIKSNYEPQYSTGGGYAYGFNGGNDKLVAEMTNELEAGIEFSLFKKFVSFDFSYFSRLSDGQIILPRLSYGSGFVLKMMNGGKVKNVGTEVQAIFNPIVKKNFNWNLVFNFTQYKGRVLSLAEDLPELYDSDTWLLSGVRSAVLPGYSMGALSGTQFMRNTKGDVLIDPATGLPVAGTDRYYPIADRLPKFTLGMVNKFNYKDWYLTFLWDWRKGGDVLNGLDYNMYTLGMSTKTLNREDPRVIRGVLKDGLENSENPTINHIAVTPYTSSAYYFTNIEPGMFVERNIYTMRLRDITLSYRLPKRLTRFLGERSSLKAFFTATDLVMFTNYTGLDPESNSNTTGIGGIGGYGIDFGNMARPKGFNLGVNLQL
ncbi:MULTISPECIES: SusC/RagA family TonB-linked outer membrane protein [unclassified Sphingobacterium]|uniref:SusC/RagA family TonB-linked outer membrane protein n=1 Tax=unclassified Sphingobacterium TaxID=2609468 RepID=UPI0026014764|nr:MULTISPECIES: SusC/RagA family TonB-linked outer membrane protein [unclassified Sphingobacterium]